MKCPYCYTVMRDGLCHNYGCEHSAFPKRYKTEHANHVLLAIPNNKLQGLRVGDIATGLLAAIKAVWVDKYSPFCPGSGREKDANAITLELTDRHRDAGLTITKETKQ